MHADADHPSFTPALTCERHGSSLYWIDAALVQPLIGGADQVAKIDTLFTTQTALVAVLKDEPGRSIVHHVEHQGRHWVIKHYFTTLRKQFFGQLIRGTPAWREWHAARLLQATGIRCNPPVAIRQQGPTGLGRQSLLFAYVPGLAIDLWIKQAAPRAHWPRVVRQHRLAVAREVGLQAGRMVTRGIANRDHKLSNLIMELGDPQAVAEPVMIDPLGVGRLRGTAQVARMLAVLLRTTYRAGFVTRREELTCLRGFLDAAEGFCPQEEDRMRFLIRQVREILKVGESTRADLMARYLE